MFTAQRCGQMKSCPGIALPFPGGLDRRSKKVLVQRQLPGVDLADQLDQTPMEPSRSMLARSSRIRAYPKSTGLESHQWESFLALRPWRRFWLQFLETP